MTLTGRHNIAKMYSSTTGTGTLTLTTAVALCNTFALAGVVTGEKVTYVITDPVAGREVGRGTYTAAGLTLTRDTVLSSTNGGSKISCSGRQTVAITIAAEDLSAFAVMKKATSQTINNTVTATVQVDTVVTNTQSVVSLAANTITFLYAGWYEVNAIIHAEGGAAFSVGYIMLLTNNSSATAADLNMRYPTNATFSANEIHFQQNMLMAANDTLLIGLENQSGQNLTVVALEVAVTLKNRV
jgi:hypothetical protein